MKPDITEKLLTLLLRPSDKEQHFEAAIRFAVLQLVAVLAVAILSIYALLDIVDHSYFSAAFFLVSAASIVLLVWYIRRRKIIDRGCVLFALLTGLIVVVDLVFDDHYSGVTAYFVLYPVMLNLTLQRKLALRILGIVCVLSLIVLFLPALRVYAYPFGLSGFFEFTLPIAFSMVFTSITQRLVARNSGDQQKRIRELEKEIEDKEAFISKLSHQIRTPLNNIMVVSNLVYESSLDQGQKDLMDTIIASTNNLVNVVNNIVKVSGFDFRGSTASEVNFDLNTIMATIVGIFNDQKIKDLEITFRKNESLNHMVTGEPVRIKQIFLNIIENLIRIDQTNQINIDLSSQTIKETSDSVRIQFDAACTYFRPLKPSDKAKAEQLSDFTIAERIIEALGSKLHIDRQDNVTRFCSGSISANPKRSLYHLNRSRNQLVRLPKRPKHLCRTPIFCLWRTTL